MDFFWMISRLSRKELEQINRKDITVNILRVTPFADFLPFKIY
jgi:hypothetical protein